MPLTDRAVAGVVVAGVRAAADEVAAVPGVAVARVDRFGLGEDTAFVRDSKKLDIFAYWLVWCRSRRRGVRAEKVGEVDFPVSPTTALAMVRQCKMSAMFG